MELELKTLRKTINKAYLKETVDRSSFDHFKGKLGQLISNVASAEEKSEHEEHFKNFLVPFFNEIGFDDYYINTNVRIDLAVHTDSKIKDPVGLLLEVKRPSNKSEMISEASFNRKAIHEAVLYYLEQRLETNNDDLKHVIITDTLNWFVFDAQEFERCFYKPSALRNVYKSWKNDQKVSSKYALGVLSSKLLSWYFRFARNEFDELFPKIRINEFKKLPLKIVKEQEELADVVDPILTAKKNNSQADTTDLEEKIDGLVYEIYDLTEEEIEIVEESVGN